MGSVAKTARPARGSASTPPTAQEHRLAVLALFVVSAAGLVFEITLTRLFSLFFQYHFTFLAVSLAVLGLSAGAASAYYLPRSRRHAAQQLHVVLIGLSLALSGATLIIAWLPSADSIFPRAMVALVVFFLIGLFDALTFVRFTADSSALYAADLIGAAFGVVVVLWLLSVWSAFSMTLFLAALIGGLALFLTYRSPDQNRRTPLIGAAAGSLLVGVGLLTVNLMSGSIDFDPTKISGVTRDKTMIAILQDPSQNGRILYTAYSPFARVDVIQTNDATSRYIFADGGAGAYMVKYDNNPQTLDQFRNTVEFLPFAAANAAKTLVIGAGGGKDILLALGAKAQSVTAVEVNPAVIAATRYFGAYNGHVLDLPPVTLVEGDARSFAERTTDQFDMIYLSLVYTQAVEPASQALVENYIFTRQAMATYIRRLAPGGRLAIVSHNGLEGSRAAVTALQAMDDMGVAPAQALDHLWLWRYPASDATLSTSVLIVSKDAFTADALGALTTAARALGMQPLYAPGSYETLFSSLRKGQPLSTFIQAGGAYNLSPTDDDQPYFFNLDYGLPPAIGSSLLIAALLAFGLLVVAVVAQTSDPTVRRGRSGQSGLFIAYGGLIGVGFMLIEIPLIQRFQLLLGQPILSLAVVLATLLLAGGIGSGISQRWPVTALPARVALAGTWIAAAALVYWFGLPGLLNSLLGTSFAVRLLATCALTALIGVPMGIPFPGLLRMAADDHTPIALLWAINGAFSVLGSTLALVISMQWGFRWAMLGGAAAYLLVAGLVLVVRRVRARAMTQQTAADKAAVSQA